MSLVDTSRRTARQKDSTLGKNRDAPGLGRVGAGRIEGMLEIPGAGIPKENFSILGCSQIPGLSQSFIHLFSLFFSSPGLSFYTRVLENCEDEAKFDEVGEIFHPFYPRNPTCFPRIPSPGEIPAPNFYWAFSLSASKIPGWAWNFPTEG